MKATLRQAQGERVIPYADEHWFKLLQQAVAETSVTAVAIRLSAGYAKAYSRPALSQILNGLYLASPVHIAARVLDVLDRWECPYLNAEIVAEECRAIHAGATPSHNPARLAQRRVCRTCAHNTTGGTSHE